MAQVDSHRLMAQHPRVQLEILDRSQGGRGRGQMIARTTVTVTLTAAVT
jgi:hypothetical protein